MNAVWLVVGAAIPMMLLERIAGARRWPRIRGWATRAWAANGLQAATVFAVGSTWDRWFPGLRLWNADALGTIGGAVVAYLAITFVYYWWHRARHEIPLLWRWLHQLHHSPQRIEIITSFYKHPLEVLANGALSSFVVYGLVGVGPAAGTLAVALTGLAELSYHWNVRTPWWVGFIVQRPEAHCVHHQRDWHRQNFSDLPLWDMLFGTFHNPREQQFACGFRDLREKQLVALMTGRDVNPRSGT